jgi:hypothetical protein
MKTFFVDRVETSTSVYRMEIEADNENEALDMAAEISSDVAGNKYAPLVFASESPNAEFSVVYKNNEKVKPEIITKKFYKDFLNE